MKGNIITGRRLSLLGTLILCAGLLGSGFELISAAAFRLVVFIGVIVHAAALVTAVKRSEF